MALINWDDEEQKKKDELFGATPVKQVASVQDGAWQPAPSGADSAVATDDITQGGIFGQQPAQAPQQQVQENYLVSDDKAQVDQSKAQRDAEIQTAREQDAARQRAEAAAVISRQFREGEARTQQGERVDVDAIKKDQGWKKYYDKEFKREKDGLDFWGRLMDGGAASRRAENSARGKQVSELLLRAYDDNGNVLNSNAAREAKKFAAYNSVLAQDNSTRGRAAGEAIGAFDRKDSGFLGRLNDTVNAMRQMSVYDSLGGVDNKHKTGADDLFRFGGNVIQGIGTALPVGGKAVYEGAVGKGTDYSTGFEKDLDGGERAGRVGSGAIDVVGTFFGGSGQLVKSLGAKAAKGVATQTEKTLLKKLVSQHLIPSLVEGGEAGAQAAAEYFGNDGTLLDENGDIDMERVGEFLAQTGQSAAMGVAAGGVFTGTAAGVNRFKNRGGGSNAGAVSEKLPEVEYTPVEDANVSFEPGVNDSLTPATQPNVADGMAIPENVTPAGDGNITLENIRPEPVTPAPTITRDSVVPAADGVVTPISTDVTPAEQSSADTYQEAAQSDIPVVRQTANEMLTDRGVTPVAEGVAQAPQVVPFRDQNLPVIKNEEAAALRESRAGKSQAEEAAINQGLQQLENTTPRYKTESVKESNLAEDISIQELDRSLTTIRQRREQLIADGRSENYHMVKNLDQAADAIIKQQEDIANGVRNTSTVDGENTRLFGENAQDVGYTDSIRTEGGKRAVGVTQDGAGESSIIIDRNAKNAEAVFHHEAVHKTLNDFATPENRANVVDSYRKHHGIDEKMGNDQIEELLSDDFAKFVSNKRTKDAAGNPREGMDLPAKVLDYFEEAWQRIKDTYASLKANGTLTPEFQKLYNDLNNGKYVDARAINKAIDPRIPNRYMVAGANAKNFDADNKNVIPEPFENNLPNDMMPNAPTRSAQPVPRKPRPTVTPEQEAIDDFADRVFTNTDLHKDFKTRLARALGMTHDKDLPVEELLATSKLSKGEKATITKKFGELEAVANEYNALMSSQRKGYKKGQISGLNDEMSRQANSLIDKYGRIERDLNSRVRRIQGRNSFANRAANVAENLTGARNANVLTSVGGIERNLTQELGVNILETVMHPVRMMRNSVKAPAEIIRAYKRSAREFTNAPKTISEAFPYLLGNTYRLIMSPVTGVANVRKSVSREVLAESLLRAQGESPTRADIKRFAGAMGADSEVVANSMMGIMNGMTSHGKGLEVMRAYQDFIKTGSPAAKERFLANTEAASNLAAKMTQVAAESEKPGVRMGVALMNVVFPFVNTATNLARTAVTYNLNPVARSVNDETLKAVRSNPANVMTILKSRAVNYGVMVGVYGLYEAGVIGYNDGEDVSKPTGIYIDRGNGKFFPVRGTPVELPIAAVVTAAKMASDIADGSPRPAAYYAGIIGKSLPYVDSANNLVAATASATDEYMKGDGTKGTGDNGYAAKSYGVSLAKSLVPWSNNGAIPASNAVQGKSTNAKTAYDKDIPTWFGQSIRSAYDPAFRESLKDSRDMAGRVRTVDQQGGFTINKNINDRNTATYNAPIVDLIKYGQKNRLGKSTQDMFNTYDTGKNNNFKSVQDSITFLDAVDGTPDNTKKLESNAKLTDLSKQMRDGFYGETGSELLTLDGQQLKSDASVPNKAGSKNSKLPVSMQSIKNAIAQTDLPKEEGDKLYAISQQSTELYNQMKAKNISYDQYAAAKAELGKQEISILSASESYGKMVNLFDHLDDTGFFKDEGLGSTRSGQTYLWNSLNALLGSKGATPAANYPKDEKGFTPFGRGGGSGTGRSATNKPGDRGNKGLEWTPVKARQMAGVQAGKYTPVNIKVKLGNAVKKDKSQNYSDRSF